MTTRPLDYVTPETPPRRVEWSAALGKLGPFIGLIFVYLLFTVLVNVVPGAQRFATAGNFELMLRQTAVVGTAALGMTLIIISGGIDLSVGANIALSTVVVASTLLAFDGRGATAAALAGVATAALAGLFIGAMVIGRVVLVVGVVAGSLLGFWLVETGWGWGIAVPSGLAVVFVAWLIERYLVGRVELSPFIVTLGLWGALRGAAKGFAGNTRVYPAPLEDPDAWRATWLAGLIDTLAESRQWMLLPPGVWAMIVLAVLMACVLRYTRFGRHVFAIGSNEQTARLCGVRIGLTKVLIYTIAGALVGIAAVLDFSYTGAGDPVGRMGAELDVIAAVVIGGASLSGGQGSVLGSLVGALIMTMVANGCTKLGLPNWVQEIVTGGIIIFAVTLDRLRQRRQA